MNIIITAAAKNLLDEQDVAYYEKQTDILYLDAVDFGDDASRLAGPFNEKYGMVYVRFKDNLKPLQEIFKEWDQSRMSGETYMPESLRRKLKFHYGDGTCYWIRRQPEFSFISDLDYELMPLEERVGYEQKDQSKCTHFFATKRGMAHMLQYVTDEEMLEWQVRCQKAKERAEKNAHKETMCAERPYMVSVCGNDDASWGLTFATMDQAMQCVRDLHQYGFGVVDEQMCFTN